MASQDEKTEKTTIRRSKTGSWGTERFFRFMIRKECEIVSKLKSVPKQQGGLFVLAYYIVMMVTLGASDGLRGVFLPLFEDSFTLNKTQSSMIIMFSYIGNLLFLFIGGYFLDRMSKKKFLLVVTFMWMVSLVCYIFTESYPILLIAMIFSLGASTMLSTSLNVVTPLLFASPAFFINVFSFANGVGIFSAQNIGGRIATRIQAWHLINLVLLILGIIALLFLSRIHFPKQEIKAEKGLKGTIHSYLSVMKNPACKYLICICGFYCITEHGLQNWLVTYGSEYLGFTRSRAALFLSIFFGGITVGRLIFAPLVQKLTPVKSVSIFSGIAAVLYITGILLERTGIVPLLLSGLAFSILWPTLVMVIGSYYPSTQNGIAVGLVSGLATFFDIAFNAGFGTLVEKTGFAVSIKILPVAAALLFLVFMIMRKRVVPYAA